MLGDTMNVLKYKRSNVISPKNFRNHGMYRIKTSQKRVSLDDFVGKFQAMDKINSVALKHDFKNQGV